MTFIKQKIQLKQSQVHIKKYMKILEGMHDHSRSRNLKINLLEEVGARVTNFQCQSSENLNNYLDLASLADTTTINSQI